MINDLYDFVFTTAITYLLGIIPFLLISSPLWILTYIFNCYTTMCIGRKAGLEDDWMAFVPVANSIYRLSIVNQEWWKLFFFDKTGIASALISASLVSLIIYKPLGPVAAFVFFLIIWAIYSILVFLFNLSVNYKYYKSFDFNPMITFISLAVGWGQIVTNVIDVLIAYSNKCEFVGLNYDANNRLERAMNYVDEPTAAAASGTIEGVSGMYNQQKFKLGHGEELIFGRDSAFSHIIIDVNAAKVSRKHCSITFDTTKNSYIVTDFSSNGTFPSNGTRLVANMPTTISRGTIISLGNKDNQFKLN